jgi:hypothetical protein
MGRFSGLIVTLAFSLAAVLLLTLAWPAAIENFGWIRPTGQDTLAQWIDNFRLWGLVGTAVCATLSILWFCLGEFYWKVVTPLTPIWWWVFLVICGIASVVPAAFMLTPADGSLAAYAIYIGNFLAVFGLPTIAFSPATVMFVPPGSKLLRK